MVYSFPFARVLAEPWNLYASGIIGYLFFNLSHKKKNDFQIEIAESLCIKFVNDRLVILGVLQPK